MRLEKKKKKGVIEKEISDSKKQQGKRLENLKKVAKDKKIEAKVARELKRGGTVEGAKAMEKGVKKAGDVTDKEFGKQEKGIKKEVFNPAQERETELDKRSETAKADGDMLKRAMSKMDTAAAKDKVKDAAAASRDDSKFLNTKEKDQKKSRVTGQKETQRQKEIVDRNKIAF
ncbi:hypothetical protein ACFL6U_02895 [Planctomycetota bacterium]